MILDLKRLEDMPRLYATEYEKDPLVRHKFFYPDFEWTWYAIEWDREDLFFGLVAGFENELGYFRLSELISNRGKLGCEIEEDLAFKPLRLSEIKRQLDDAYRALED